jgi:hypothetical protein
MTSRMGQQLGNYRLLRLLDVGGFAEVYLGEHVYLNTSSRSPRSCSTHMLNSWFIAT